MPATEQLIAVYVDGKSYSFSRGGLDAASFYGGPAGHAVGGRPFGPARLHHVASLDASGIPVLRAQGRHVHQLPLLYGFRFNGCALEYRFETNGIELLRISPDSSSDDWPYPDYPALLPYIPVDAGPPVVQDWKTFSDRFFGFADEQPAELVAVVPPAFSTGQSLWGRDGDLEGVCVVFECDLGRQLVRAYNICG